MQNCDDLMTKFIRFRIFVLTLPCLTSIMNHIEYRIITTLEF